MGMGLAIASLVTSAVAAKSQHDQAKKQRKAMEAQHEEAMNAQEAAITEQKEQQAKSIAAQKGAKRNAQRALLAGGASLFDLLGSPQ